MKPQAYSFSRLDLYERCPWAYKLKYLDGVPRQRSEALETGSTLHGLIADYLTSLAVYGHPTDWDWARGATPAVGPADVAQVWTRFYESFVMPAADSPKVEQKIAFDRAWRPTEYFGPEAYFRLVVDFTFRQDGLAVVIDWKSNRTLPDEVAKDLQLRIYGWGVRQALYPDAREVLLRLHFLRYGAEREVLLDAADLDGTPQELEARIAQVEADGRFDPAPGSFCGHCGLTAHCPVMAQALAPREIVAPATRADAEKAARLLLALREMDAVVADALKHWVRENGEVLVGDLVYGPAASLSYDLDAQAVAGALLDAGLDKEQVWPLLGVTKTGLERGLKKLKRRELIPAILEMFPCKTVEKIGFRKA